MTTATAAGSETARAATFLGLGARAAAKSVYAAACSATARAANSLALGARAAAKSVYDAASSATARAANPLALGARAAAKLAGKWGVNSVNFAVVAYACHGLVRAPTFRAFVMLVAALLFHVNFVHRIRWLMFKAGTARAHTRSRGNRDDHPGQQRIYLEFLKRQPRHHQH